MYFSAFKEGSLSAASLSALKLAKVYIVIVQVVESLKTTGDQHI